MTWKIENGQLELYPIFDMRSPNAGLYDTAFNFGCIKIKNDSSFLDNIGWGTLSSPPANYYQWTT